MALNQFIPQGDEPLVDNDRTVTNLWYRFFADGIAKLVLRAVYPVGSLYFTTTADDPAITLGFGDWVAYAEGQVPVGFKSGDPDFGVLGDTGGEKTHTLTAAETPDNTDPGVDVTAGGAQVRAGLNHTGNGAPHNILQPFVVVAIWNRIA